MVQYAWDAAGQMIKTAAMLTGADIKANNEGKFEKSASLQKEDVKSSWILMLTTSATE